MSPQNSGYGIAFLINFNFLSLFVLMKITQTNPEWGIVSCLSLNMLVREFSYGSNILASQFLGRRIPKFGNDFAELGMTLLCMHYRIFYYRKYKQIETFIVLLLDKNNLFMVQVVAVSPLGFTGKSRMVRSTSGGSSVH